MLFSLILFLSSYLVFFLFPLTSLHPQFFLKITLFCPLCSICHLYFVLALIAGLISLISFFSVQLWDFFFYVTLHCWQLYTSFRNMKKPNTRAWMFMILTSLHCLADTKEIVKLAENNFFRNLQVLHDRGPWKSARDTKVTSSCHRHRCMFQVPCFSVEAHGKQIKNWDKNIIMERHKTNHSLYNWPN